MDDTDRNLCQALLRVMHGFSVILVIDFLGKFLLRESLFDVQVSLDLIF